MPKILLDCLYCGNRYEYAVFYQSEVEDLTCNKCGDSNLKVITDLGNKDVFGYNSTDPKPDAYIKKYKK